MRSIFIANFLLNGLFKSGKIWLDLHVKEGTKINPQFTIFIAKLSIQNL
jgi:hypothetical protein